MALPVGVKGRSLRTKLFLMRFTQLGDPVGIRFDGVFDQGTLHPHFTQVRSHPQRSLAPPGMVGHEVLDVAAVIDELLGAQPLDHFPDDGVIVTLIDEFAAQILGRTIAARQGIERRHPGGTRIERV